MENRRFLTLKRGLPSQNEISIERQLHRRRLPSPLCSVLVIAGAAAAMLWLLPSEKEERANLLLLLFSVPQSFAQVEFFR